MPDLDLDADLRLSVTSPAGEHTTAVLSGRGREVRLDVERPDVLLGSVGRTDVGRLADLLSAAGVTVRVFGPAGPAGVIGAGASSRVGRLVTGSTAVAPASGTARAVFGGRPGSGGRAARAGAAAGAALGVLALVALVRRLLRGSR